MQSHEESVKTIRKRVVILNFISFIILAAAITGLILLFERVSLLESQLNTYVLLAAKSHAALNFERRDFRLLASGSQNGRPMSLAEKGTNAEKLILVASRWEELYIKTYNESMRPALSGLITNKP